MVLSKPKESMRFTFQDVPRQLVFLAVVLLSCLVAPAWTQTCDRSTTLPPPEFGQPYNLDGLKQELTYYKCSGAYERDLGRVVDRAMSYLQNLPAHQGKLALVLDIDETSLSNWDEIIANDFGYIPYGDCSHLPKGPCGFDSWQHAAAAPAIKPILTLFNLAISKGIGVFFITGRIDQGTAREDTAANLKKAGYTGWTNLIMKLPTDASSVQIFKTGQRDKIEKDGYHIVENVGDQYSDLNGGYAEQTFKLPNPFYFIP